MYVKTYTGGRMWFSLTDSWNLLIKSGEMSILQFSTLWEVGWSTKIFYGNLCSETKSREALQWVYIGWSVFFLDSSSYLSPMQSTYLLPWCKLAYPGSYKWRKDSIVELRIFPESILLLGESAKSSKNLHLCHYWATIQLFQIIPFFSTGISLRTYR